jgi:YVTN family beta-propeller protein
MAASFAYVTTAAPVGISKIETVINTVVATINLGDISEIAGLAVTPNGARAYVATNDREFQGAIKVLDTAANTVIATIRNGFVLNGITIAPNGKRAYVTDDHSLFAIDTTTNSVVAAVQFDFPPVGVATDGKRVYVPNATHQAGAMNLRVVDATTNAVVATAPLNGSADGIALTPDGKRLYLSTSEGGLPGKSHFPESLGDRHRDQQRVNRSRRRRRPREHRHFCLTTGAALSAIKATHGSAPIIAGIAARPHRSTTARLATLGRPGSKARPPGTHGGSSH